MKKLLLFHFIAGIKSNIPICCVLYYCFWIYLFGEYPQAEEHIEYFRCPLCKWRGSFHLLVEDGKNEEYYYLRLLRGYKNGK